MKRTWVSMKYWVGFSSYKCGLCLLFTMSFRLGFTWISKAHHARTMALVMRGKMFALFFCITNGQKKLTIDCMDSLWQIAMAMFLGWTLSNCAFYLNEVVEPSFIRAVRITCFGANFTILLGLFTSDNDCATLESNSLCIITSFTNPIRFGMTSFTMGSSITFCITSTFVKMLENVARVFSICRNMTFATLLTFQSTTTTSPISSSTCFAILELFFFKLYVFVDAM